MSTTSTKRVTVLVYAAGNNELEPEIWNSVGSGFHASTNGSVVTLVMVGRWPRSLVSLMRPSQLPVHRSDSWTGTRQYLLTAGSSELISESAGVCMADPAVLFDFIHRGARDYPADQYILVLSGHACQHVGFLTDYGPSGPHLMGTVELGRAVRDACHRAQISLDVLVMDVCCCNCLEAIYEISAESYCRDNANDVAAVKGIVTHVNDGPLSGIALGLIARAASAAIKHCPSYEGFAAEIMRDCEIDLVGIRTPQASLVLVRDLTEKLVAECEAAGLSAESPRFGAEISRYGSLDELRRVVEQMTICSRPARRQPHAGAVSISISIPFEPYYSKMYSRLRLVSHTGWGKLLGCAGSCAESAADPTGSGLAPLLLPRQVLLANVQCMNPWMNQDQVCRTVSRLSSTIGWTRADRDSDAETSSESWPVMRTERACLHTDE